MEPPETEPVTETETEPGTETETEPNIETALDLLRARERGGDGDGDGATGDGAGDGDRAGDRERAPETGKRAPKTLAALGLGQSARVGNFGSPSGWESAQPNGEEEQADRSLI